MKPFDLGAALNGAPICDKDGNVLIVEKIHVVPDEMGELYPVIWKIRGGR